jgi:predicted DNA-binding protein
MSEKGRAPVRLNTRISADTNEWLDKRAYEMGLTKSAVINLAVEAYRKEVETVRAMPEVLRKLNDLQRM